MVESSFDDKTECLTIFVDGRFDYSCHKLFKEAFVSANKAASVYEIDLSRVTYLDSSALGMLLLLRDHAGGEKSGCAFKEAEWRSVGYS